MKTLLITLAILATPLLAAAQFAIPGADSALSLSLTPEHPGPNGRVTLSLSSGLYDLENSTITWTLNGRPLGSGVGLTEEAITTGALGETSEVVAAVSGESGVAQTSVRVIPSAIDLLWEASSYVPPFFKGRPLPSAGASVTLVALPHFIAGGQPVDPRMLIYTWRRNGDVLGSISGRGRASAVIEAPSLYGSDVVSVTAAAPDAGVSGEASVTLFAATPRLVLYLDQPIYGILYHQALGTQASVSDAEATFAAMPLFAPVMRANDPRLIYEWRVNQNAVIPDAANPNEITINAAKSKGSAALELSLSHATNYFLSADASWNVLFGSAGNAGAITNDPFHSQQ